MIDLLKLANIRSSQGCRKWLIFRGINQSIDAHSFSASLLQFQLDDEDLNCPVKVENEYLAPQFQFYQIINGFQYSFLSQPLSEKK
jgi:hypothetical protein